MINHYNDDGAQMLANLGHSETKEKQNENDRKTEEKEKGIDKEKDKRVESTKKTSEKYKKINYLTIKMLKKVVMNVKNIVFQCDH